MALDATVAGATADSYLTVAEADAFAAADYGPEATGWTAAVTPVKEAVLRRATREIDAYLRSDWTLYAFDQALLFPRATDHTVAPEVGLIPRNIKLATYEQATYVLANATALDRAAARLASGRSSYSEPNISETESTAPLPVISPAALAFLARYGGGGSAMSVQSIRMGSGAWQGWTR